MDDTTPFRPLIRTRTDLQRVWRHLLSRRRPDGCSLWVLLIEPDDRPLLQVSEITDVVAPPTPVEMARLTGRLAELGSGLTDGGRLAVLRIRPGAGGPTADDLGWASSLYVACWAASIACEVVHLATDETILPVPMDAVIAA